MRKWQIRKGTLWRKEKAISPFEETRTLRLSDAFMDVPGSKSKACLEFTATVININYGNNKELLSQCRVLEEYALFNHQLRIYL